MKLSKRKKIALTFVFILCFIFFVLPFLIPIPNKQYVEPQNLSEGIGFFIKIDNVQTHEIVEGPENGTPIILVHGFGGSTYNWRFTIKPLADAGFRVYAIDLKGFGLADKNFDEDYSHRSQAEFIKNYMDAKKIDKATLIGHSMGGNVISFFAMNYPERVNKLVYVDGAINETSSMFSGFSEFFANFAPTRQWFRVIAGYLGTEQNLVNLGKSAYYNGQQYPDTFFDHYADILKTKDWDLALLGVTRDSSKNVLPKNISELKFPTLIIWGREDTWVPLNNGEKLNRDIVESRMVIIDQSGHLPMEEKPDEFNKVLIDFLSLQ